MAMLAAAGIGAAGSIIGGLTGGKGAKKAAKIQQQTAQQQIAANKDNQQYITGLEQPTIDRGNTAGGLYADFIGAGSDPAAAQDALSTFRGSSGYQDLLNTGLASVNSNAYARGLGSSGATLKALQAKGSAIADQSAQQWLGNLGVLNNMGNQAIGNIAGVSTNTTNANNAALQNGADASSNAALIQNAAWQQAIQNLSNTGANYASSYGGGTNSYGVRGGNIY